jgi:prepilin-type N-terminal cleavage/methylation domain-containing protein
MGLANMKKFFGKDNKGFSFVEILCAIAIMSLVSVTVGTVIVVTARTYRSGVSETTVQQEAQLAANSIGNIIKDASKVVYYEEGKGKLEDGELVEEYSGNTKLTVVTNQNLQYDFVYDSENNVITYTEISSDGTSSTPQLLASNIGSFSAITTDFKEARSITVNMEVNDEGTGKSVPLSYTMNSRNEVAGDVSYVEVPDAPVIIFLDDMACIVPGEGEVGDSTKYKIPVYVSGSLDENQLEASYTTDDGILKIGAITTDYVEVYISATDYDKCASSYKLTLKTKAKNADGSPVASSDCMVYIRTVKNITTTYNIDISGTSDSNRQSKGAVYKYTAAVEGYNLTKFNRDFDLLYKNGYSVYWSYELKANGVTYTYDSSKSEENQYSNKVDAEKYIQVTDIQTAITRPTLDITLTDDIPSDFSLTVKATSMHANGVNIAGVAYATVIGEVTVSKINDNFEVTLEPNETETFDLGQMIGDVAATSNVSFKYFIRNVANTAYNSYSVKTGTKAEYIRNINSVRISIGNEEKGNGYNEGTEPYTFYIGVYVDNKLASRIKVHVRRIDYLHIRLVNASEDDVYDTGTVYHFRVRYNSTTDGQSDNIIKYLIDADNMTDLQNALAVQLTWAIKDKNSENVISDEDFAGSGYTFEALGTVDKVTVKAGWSLDNKIKDNQDYIVDELKPLETVYVDFNEEGYSYHAVVKKPMVRIYYEDEAKTKVLGYSMVQAAELDIRLQDKTNSATPVTNCKHSDGEKVDLSKVGNNIGLSSGKKLIVKAVALHPYAEYNRGGADYVLNEEDITDTYVLSQ